MRQLGNFLRLAGGREFILKVPGVMGSGLSDAQVAELSNWVLVTLAGPSLPAGHLPFQAAEVARARAKPIADVGAERRRLVEQATWLGIAIDLDLETEIRPPPGDAGATGPAQSGWLA